MPWLMVALIGPGKGPKVPLAQKKAVLRVTGCNGGCVRAFVDEELKETTYGNGNFDLPTGDFAQIEYDGKSKILIAEIVRET